MNSSNWTVVQWIAYLLGCFVIGVAIPLVVDVSRWWLRMVLCIGAAFLWSVLLQLPG